jgi:glycosyltransferase involved in cell wall biosynthesis
VKESLDAITGIPDLLVSIIVPAKNEAADIRRTLEACLAVDYPRKEVIVVDDSSDETPQIVESYASQGVRLIHRDRNLNGCCGARNEGIRHATGDVVMLLNADAVLQKDLLSRVMEHYHRQADYVILRSTVLNQDKVWGRLLEAEASESLSRNPDMEWSEAFTCRREAAQSVGLIPGDFPIPFCRDWRLGAALSAAGFKKVIDTSIPAYHIVPDTLPTFWRQWTWRGSIIPPATHYFGGHTRAAVLLRETLRAIRTVGLNLLLLPGLFNAARLTRHSGRGLADLVPFWGALCVKDMATALGCLKGTVRLCRVRKIAS